MLQNYNQRYKVGLLNICFPLRKGTLPGAQTDQLNLKENELLPKVLKIFLLKIGLICFPVRY